MPLPQIVVKVTAALPRRGAPTATGTAFMATAAGTGPTNPIRLRSRAEAEAAFGAIPFSAWVGDVLAEGAPEVIAIRATGALAALTEAEWTAALDEFADTYGPGQVLIPGVSDAAAHAALAAHAATSGRTALLDGDETPTVAELAALADARSAADAAPRMGVIAPWVPYPTEAGGPRLVPGSVAAAGLAARGDARVGHANHAPAGEHSGGAGVLRGALRDEPMVTFTAADLDTLYDANVNVIVPGLNGPTLMGWRSLSDDARFRQLNTGRLMMQLGVGVDALMRQFLFRQIDGAGLLYAEVDGSLRGYLLDLYSRQALYGATADDAFDVAVAEVNTAATAAAGELRAAVEVKATQHTERIVIDVVVGLADAA